MSSVLHMSKALGPNRLRYFFLAMLGIASCAENRSIAVPPANPLFLPETPNRCGNCAEWNRPHPPVQVFGNTWWVGVDGLSVVAIDTGAGIILLDGALPQSVPLVKASLAATGLKLSDVKFIGNSHTHFDHAGGIAALQRESGATVMASARSAEALRSGCPNPDGSAVRACYIVGMTGRYKKIFRVDNCHGFKSNLFRRGGAGHRGGVRRRLVVPGQAPGPTRNRLGRARGHSGCASSSRVGAASGWR